MKLDLRRLKKSPGEKIPFDWSESQSHIDLRGRKLPLTKPISAVGRASFIDGLVQVELDLNTEVEAECSRCLTAIDISLQIKDELRFLEEPKGGLDAPLVEEFSFEYGVDELELTPFLAKLIASEIETKPLCKPDCKGLCSECGIDLNLEQCDCHEEKSVDPRLEKLKELL